MLTSFGFNDFDCSLAFLTSVSTPPLLHQAILLNMIATFFGFLPLDGKFSFKIMTIILCHLVVVVVELGPGRRTSSLVLDFCDN